jgi:Protein of unknown function (DUF3383)
MATTPPLALSNIVDITVQVSPTAAAVSTFNVGLFVGPSPVIPSYGDNSRVQLFTGTAAMLAAGFTVDQPEFIAAQIYFSQTQPAFQIAIGRQDLTAIGALTIDVAGTLWAVGDQFSITQSGATFGVGTVLAEAGGVPSAIGIVTQGTAYSVATGLATTAISPSTGTGLTVNVTALGESLTQAVVACRAASGAWYGLTVNAPVDADNLALAQFADPLWQTTRYYPFSSDTTIPAGTANNLALQLQELELRVLGQYATTQNGLFPNNVYASVALMGLEMGLNTGLANSFFTVAHKQLIGIAPEPLTQTQYANIKAAGFNVYGNFQNIQLEEPGFMSNGAPSYLWLNLAMYVAQLQSQEMAVLQDNPAVSQTNAGEQLLLHAANNAGSFMAAIGFLAENTWSGSPVNIPGVSVAVGQAIPGGFLNLAQPYSQQSPANRDAGQAMPIFSFITTAGAVQSLVIGVFTQL